MATTFLSRFQREKSERENNKEKSNKSGGFSLSLSRSAAALSQVLNNNKSDVNANKVNQYNKNTDKDLQAQQTNNEEEQKQQSQQQSARQPRRYMRSATAASVTQLLSEGCNNLLQRFRRNPSERPDKRQQLQQQQQKENW